FYSRRKRVCSGSPQFTAIKLCLFMQAIFTRFHLPGELRAKLQTMSATNHSQDFLLMVKQLLLPDSMTATRKFTSCLLREEFQKELLTPQLLEEMIFQIEWDQTILQWDGKEMI